MDLDALAPFIGIWDNEAVFPGEWDAPPVEGAVTTRFEWTLEGAFLLQASAAPAPIPNGHCLIGSDPDRNGYLQHYFDSRGVARVYAMTFDGLTWTLERTAADFTALDFAQRYSGTFSDDGDHIDGEWQICHDGSTWERDFVLNYHRRPWSNGTPR